MRYKSSICFLLLIAALVWSPALALADDETHGEVQIIVDFIDGHEVTVFLPEQSNPDPLVKSLEAILGGKLKLQESWLEQGGGAVWLYTTPRMLPRFGLIKQAQWDLTPLLAAAGHTGLERLDAFLVVGLAGGLLNYDVSVSDQYGPVAISDVDGWEMWWGFGLTPDGEAPDLFTNIMLQVGWSPMNLLPLLLPVAAALLLWLIGRRLRAKVLRWVSGLLTWVSLVTGLFTAYLMNWHGLLSYIGLTKAGSLSAVALVAMLLFFWTQLVIGLPSGRLSARLSGQAWTVKAYLRGSGVRAVVFIALVTVGWLVGAGVAFLAGMSTWLALVFILALTALLLGQMHFLTMHLIYRAKRWDEPHAYCLVQALAQAMKTAMPELYLLGSKRVKFANAYAVGLSKPRIYVTEVLWNELDDDGRRFIFAHELAHLKLGHTRPIFLGSLLPLWLVALSVASLIWTEHLWLPILPLVPAYALYFLIALPRRRGYELAADQLALQVTRNADAAVAALMAVQEVNREVLTNQRTHPAMTARVQALRATSGEFPTETSNGRK